MTMMIESGQTFTRESLAAAIVARFGAGTRFYTCSASGMTPGQLIDFLEQRGKFAPSTGGFAMPADRMCQH